MNTIIGSAIFTPQALAVSSCINIIEIDTCLMGEEYEHPVYIEHQH